MELGSENLTMIIQAENLEVVKSGRTILRIDSISVEKGEVLAIIGPNGAGKSTLLSTLACLEFPRKGVVRFQGRKVTKKNALNVRRQMAVVFQEPLLLDGTVLENVKMGLWLRGRLSSASRPPILKRLAVKKHRLSNESSNDYANDSEDKVTFWLKRFGIDNLANQLVHTLSGGEAQRTSLARAFVLEPQVLFLDEPFASLDAITRRDLIIQLKTILDESGATAIFVTHDFREVAALADRVVILNQGRIEAEGTFPEITKHPLWQQFAAVTLG